MFTHGQTCTDAHSNFRFLQIHTHTYARIYICRQIVRYRPRYGGEKARKMLSISRFICFTSFIFPHLFLLSLILKKCFFFFFQLPVFTPCNKVQWERSPAGAILQGTALRKGGGSLFFFLEGKGSCNGWKQKGWRINCEALPLPRTCHWKIIQQISYIV